MWLCFAVAQAEPAGHWHPDDLAPLSNVFRTSSETLQKPFGERSRKVEQLATALRQYREGLDLLGAAAPSAERDRLNSLEKEFERQRATLQSFADDVVADYDEAFVSAVKRAIAAEGKEIEECADKVAVAEGPAMPGMPVRTKKNSDCHGPSLNQELAVRVDADAELKTALDAILARPWPEVTLQSSPVPPIGGGERWILVRDLFMAGARDRLIAIDRADDEARMKIEAAIESGASVEELKRLEPEAQKIEAETAARRAALAQPVLEVARARMAKKWAGEPETGWCAQPVLLGGCEGEDATKELVARLLQDKKVSKALLSAR